MKRNRVYRAKHPDDHYDHFSGCWIVLLLVAGGLVLTLVLAANASSSESHSFAREHSAMQKQREKNAPRPCVSGEVMDAEVGRCLPALRTPSAADPWIMDRSVKPCDSFFKHSCGKWIQEHTNEDRAFSATYQRNAHTVLKVVEDAPVDSPIGAFYGACVASLVDKKYARETMIERRHILNKILGGVKNHADLPRAFGRMAHAGFTLPFSVAVEKHPMQSSMLLLIRWDGFEGIDEGLVSQLFAGSRDHGGSLIEAGAEASLFLRVQEELDKHHPHVEDAVNSFSAYMEEGLLQRDLNPLITLKDTTMEVGAWSWRTFFEEIDGTAFGQLARDDDIVWVPDKSYILWVIQNMNSFTIAEWTAYLRFSILYHTHEFVPQLPSNVYMKEHAWSPIGKKAARNQPHILKRRTLSRGITKKECAHMTQQLLPGYVSRAYLTRAFHTDERVERVRRQVQTLGEQVRDQVATLVEATPWLDPHTRRNLGRKVRAIMVRAVHPNLWEKEPFGASLSPDRYLHNLNLVRRWRVRQNLVLWSSYAVQRYGPHLDRDAVARFGAPLSTVNAFYSPMTNTITVFAGILQPPFFDEHYDKASLLASVGAVLGHEFSHSVDSNGARYDADGNFRPSDSGWISEESMRRFKEKQSCVVDEYNVHDLNVDCASAGSRRKRDAYGEQTLGENMADIVGVKAAYETYLHISNSTESSNSERAWFWVVFAQMWCESYDQEHLCARVASDVHSTSLFRVDKTLRNIHYFAQDYGCIAGTDKMARTLEEECTLYGE